MMITPERFQQALELYGTEIDAWPLPLRASALHALREPAFAALLEEERQLHRLLKASTLNLTDTSSLEERILFAARMSAHRQRGWLTGWLEEIFGPLSTRSAVALVSLILAGFMIGFSLPSILTLESEPSFIQTAFNDGGNL